MSDQDQLDTIADEREKHPVETIEPLSVNGASRSTIRVLPSCVCLAF
jgi:hypothetical protein